MPKTLRVGVAGLLVVGATTAGSLGGCAAQAGGDDESVAAQSSALRCLAPLCYGPIEGEAVVESACGDAGVPRDGTLLFEAYPTDLRASGARDVSDRELSLYADAPTACLEAILEAYCTQSPWESTSTFTGCDGAEHRIDISECPATVVNPKVLDAVLYEPFAALLENSGCNAYAEVFASSQYIVPYGGVYVAYDPVGSGPHKGQ